MIVLLIVVGLYTIQCVGPNCYSVSKEVIDTLLAAGLLESVYEIPKVIKIYRKKVGR